MLSFFVSSLGVLYSLWCKTSLKAMAASLTTLLFVGGGYMFCCAVCMIGSHGPGRDIEIMFAGVIPMLLALPYPAYLEPDFFRHTDGLCVAYVIGLIGYSIAGFALFSGAIVNFESLVGRIGRDFVPHRPPASQRKSPGQAPPPLVAAEIVEE
jgi:hypothetical protein